MRFLLPHLRYLRYVVLHKWFVLLAGIRYQAPILQLLLHDLTKLRPSEWLPYANYFYRDSAKPDREKQWLQPGQNKHGPWFIAMMQHCNRNPHHWQYWCSVLYDGELVAQPMPDKYIREMVADWSGAGRANGTNGDPLPWYTDIRHRLVLHPDTRRRVEELIGYQKGQE